MKGQGMGESPHPLRAAHRSHGLGQKDATAVNPQACAGSQGSSHLPFCPRISCPCFLLGRPAWNPENKEPS